MLSALVWLLVICIVIAIIWWVCDYLPVPQPLNKLLKVVSVVIGCVAIIYVLMALAGMGGAMPQLK